MKPNNIRNEQTNNNTNTENSANNSAWNSASRLQNLAEKIEEAKWTDTQTPSPKKAPLNYIDNLWEWEEAQKKYLEEVAKKQQELMTILWTYEDKTQETDRFRVAKSELEIKLEKVMWTIVDKLKDYDDFLLQVYWKIFQSESEWEDSEDSQWEEVNNNELNNNETQEVEEIKEENENIEEWDDKNPEETWEELDKDEETEENKNKDELSTQIAKFLSSLWIGVWWVSVVPISMLSQDTWKGELLDDAAEIINKFLGITERENWDKHKQLLDKTEIEWIENLRESLKKYCTNYLELLYQIDLVEAKIDKLENEENTLYSSYYTKVKEAKKMEEEMEKLNETYFLNSYLSTKSAPLESFVSSPLVEKQIIDIIESNNKWQSIPKTILLYWKENLWKTYAANVLASELKRKMYHIRSYDIFTWGFSDPNAMLDAIFNWVIKKKEPCIIFLDEIEDFAWWYEWSPYQNLLENTIRHHISKIKDSSLDIMIIWAISDKNRISRNLLKQDVFSKQIHFDTLPQDRCADFIKQIAKEYNINLNIDINKLINNLKNTDRNQEYLKKLLNMAIDCHRIGIEENNNITLSMEDFSMAIKYMSEYNRNISQGIWFQN